ncbi:MAG: hypothetical protein ACRDGH_12945 [Candidatus Limnocylindria bacterium]
MARAGKILWADNGICPRAASKAGPRTAISSRCVLVAAARRIQRTALHRHVGDAGLADSVRTFWDTAA